jgi:hypothetical protein
MYGMKDKKKYKWCPVFRLIEWENGSAFYRNKEMNRRIYLKKREKKEKPDAFV